MESSAKTRGVNNRTKTTAGPTAQDSLLFISVSSSYGLSFWGSDYCSKPDRKNKHQCRGDPCSRSIGEVRDDRLKRRRDTRGHLWFEMGCTKEWGKRTTPSPVFA